MVHCTFVLLIYVLIESLAGRVQGIPECPALEHNCGRGSILHTKYCDERAQNKLAICYQYKGNKCPNNETTFEDYCLIHVKKERAFPGSEAYKMCDKPWKLAPRNLLEDWQKFLDRHIVPTKNQHCTKSTFFWLDKELQNCDGNCDSNEECICTPSFSKLGSTEGHTLQHISSTKRPGNDQMVRSEGATTHIYIVTIIPVVVAICVLCVAAFYIRKHSKLTSQQGAPSIQNADSPVFPYNQTERSNDILMEIHDNAEKDSSFSSYDDDDEHCVVSRNNTDTGSVNDSLPRTADKSKKAELALPRKLFKHKNISEEQETFFQTSFKHMSLTGIYYTASSGHIVQPHNQSLSSRNTQNNQNSKDHHRVDYLEDSHEHLENCNESEGHLPHHYFETPKLGFDKNSTEDKVHVVMKEEFYDVPNTPCKLADDGCCFSCDQEEQNNPAYLNMPQPQFYGRPSGSGVFHDKPRLPRIIEQEEAINQKGFSRDNLQKKWLLGGTTSGGFKCPNCRKSIEDYDNECPCTAGSSESPPPVPAKRKISMSGRLYNQNNEGLTDLEVIAITQLAAECESVFDQQVPLQAVDIWQGPETNTYRK